MTLSAGGASGPLPPPRGAASQPQLSAQFNLYRSTDLQSWTPLASPLTNRQIVAPSGFDYPHRMERPKLFAATCGHVSVCEVCSRGTTRCPKCHADVAAGGWQRVYV